jgi:PhnB protein
MTTTAATSPTVTTYICVDGASDAIEFYKRAFGAEELYRLPGPDGKLGHAEIKIGETVLMLSDEWPEGGVRSPLRFDGSCVSLVLDVPDCDAAWLRALEAGAKVDRPLKDEPYGRGGWIIDPFGHRWSIMTSNADFNPEDMQ